MEYISGQVVGGQNFSKVNLGNNVKFPKFSEPHTSQQGTRGQVTSDQQPAASDKNL